MMRGCRASGLRAVLALSSLALVAASVQAKPRISVYITSRACETDGLLSAEQCRNAFANAEAEFNDRAPIFSDQEVCERQFSRCVISFAEPPNPKALRYSPAMSGVQVTVNADLDRIVVPILDSSYPTWALRGTVDPSVRVLPLSQLSRSVPRFALWCGQFCATSSGPNPRALGLNKPGTALFVPMIDPGARPYETMETHRFSRAGLPAPRSQPRFMR
jgi:hypothetical protein